MKSTFRQFISEFRSNIPLAASFDRDTLVSFIPNSKLLHIQFTIKGQKAITVYEYKIENKDIFFILTDRVNKSDIVGYMWIHNIKSDYWQVRDVTIFPEYQRQGLGTDLYTKMVNEGYKLVNGYSLSTEIEKVWRKLHQFVSVNTLNLHTNEISEFDERPKEDDTANDNSQIYFWLATQKDDNLQESLTNKCPSTIHWYLDWLQGSTKTPGGFGTFKFGEEGEF